MNSRILLAALPLLIAAILMGCGGDGEDPASQANASDPVGMADDSQANSALERLYDQIDSALDQGNYKSAISLTGKGKTVQERLELIDYVGKELGSVMAAGDQEAHAAYQRLSQIREMQRMRMR